MAYAMVPLRDIQGSDRQCGLRFSPEKTQCGCLDVKQCKNKQTCHAKVTQKDAGRCQHCRVRTTPKEPPLDCECCARQFHHECLLAAGGLWKWAPLYVQSPTAARDGFFLCGDCAHRKPDFSFRPGIAMNVPVGHPLIDTTKTELRHLVKRNEDGQFALLNRFSLLLALKLNEWDHVLKCVRAGVHDVLVDRWHKKLWEAAADNLLFLFPHGNGPNLCVALLEHGLKPRWVHHALQRAVALKQWAFLEEMCDTVLRLTHRDHLDPFVRVRCCEVLAKDPNTRRYVPRTATGLAEFFLIVSNLRRYHADWQCHDEYKDDWRKALKVIVDQCPSSEHWTNMDQRDPRKISRPDLRWLCVMSFVRTFGEAAVNWLGHHLEAMEDMIPGGNEPKVAYVHAFRSRQPLVMTLLVNKELVFKEFVERLGNVVWVKPKEPAPPRE